MSHHLISSPTKNTNKEQLFLFLFSIIFSMQLKQIYSVRALSSFIHSLMDSSSSTNHFFSFFIFIILFIPWQTLATCQNKCGSLPIKYPLGTGYGCGSPRFYPFITCQENPDPNQNQLHLTTHLGLYPITSLSYTTSTLTITPPLMSTCTSIQSSPNFGLDWSSPFQLGPSLFILLNCPSPTSSLTFSNGQNPKNPLCDSSYTHLCASIHTCPSILSLGLPIFAPTNTCCVYSPANLNSKGDLDLQGLKCATYVSVVTLGDIPTDPNRWEYGVVLKYNPVGLDNYDVATNCDACEKSDGVCGYEPPRNNFVCVCKNGLNNSIDCMGQDHQPQVLPYWSSGFKTGCGFEFGFFYGSTRLMVLLLLYFFFS